MNNTLLPTLDLKTVRFRLARDLGWNEATLDVVETEYRAFLTLCAKQTDFTPVPSKAVDEFWHYHILDTTKYIMDCLNQFGTLIHHNPETAELSPEEATAARFNFESSKQAISQIVQEAGMTLGVVTAWPFRRREEPRRQPSRPSPSPSPTPTPSSCSYTQPIYTPASCSPTPCPSPSPSSCGGGGGSSCGSSCGGGCGSSVHEDFKGITMIGGRPVPLAKLLPAGCAPMALQRFNAA